MLLDRMMPDPKSMPCHDAATDINPPVPAESAEGCTASCRSAARRAWMRERYFRKRKDGRYALLPNSRSRVTFRT